MTVRTANTLETENFKVASFVRTLTYDRFVKEVVENFSQDNLPLLRREASVLGLDLSKNRLVMIISVKDFTENCLQKESLASFERNEVIGRFKRDIEWAVNSFFTRGADTITAYLGGDKFLVAMAVEDREEIVLIRLKNSFRAIFGHLASGPINSVTVGFGKAYRDIVGLAEAAKEADLALKLGLKLGGENQSYDFEEFGILSTFAEGDLDKKARIAEKTLGSVGNSKKLFSTLKTFFEKNLSVAQTAEVLGMHPNTIIYRLEQISKEIGLDPRVFQEAVVIKTALLIQKIA